MEHLCHKILGAERVVPDSGEDRQAGRQAQTGLVIVIKRLQCTKHSRARTAASTLDTGKHAGPAHRYFHLYLVSVWKGPRAHAFHKIVQGIRQRGPHVNAYRSMSAYGNYFWMKQVPPVRERKNTCRNP